MRKINFLLAFCALLIFPKMLFSQIKITDFQEIEKNVYLLWFDQYENKAVVGEFGNFLVLMEFPQNDSLSNEVIDFLKVKFPKKELKYIAHSHHHSHSISSFDPFLQRTNAQLVTSRYNFGEIKKLTKDTLRLVQKSIIYDSTYQIQDKTNTLLFYKIEQGKYSVPTKEYIAAYFPKQKVMVSGCLLNKPKTYYEVVNARKPALKKFITDKGIQAQKFIPTNSSRANGFEDICTAAMLDSALVMGIKPNEFCDNFQSKKVEYLFSKTDSLVAEFKKIPRSFDYVICGNTLKTLRKDYWRAIAVFKPLTIIYPKEYDTYFFIAECYEGLGFIPEAKTYFEICLTLVKKEEDIAEIKQKIEKLPK